MIDTMINQILDDWEHEIVNDGHMHGTILAWRKKAQDHIDAQRERIEKLENAIQRALNDEESGNGWGPDVTVCTYLKEALRGEESE